jgi:hypothetical protein
MKEATNGFSRVVEYKGCAIDPVSTAGSWAPRWTREGKRYDRLPAESSTLRRGSGTANTTSLATWSTRIRERSSMNGVRIGIRRTGNEPRRTLQVVMNKKVEWGVLGDVSR